MTTCNIPPEGWNCSREAGHEGPCAARSDAPYNDYVDKVLSGLRSFQMNYYAGVNFSGHETPIRVETWVEAMSEQNLRSLLADAWMDGLAYSLNLIEDEKKSPLRVRLRDEPKSFQGGTKLTEPFIWEDRK